MKKGGWGKILSLSAILIVAGLFFSVQPSQAKPLPSVPCPKGQLCWPSDVCQGAGGTLGGVCSNQGVPATCCIPPPPDPVPTVSGCAESGGECKFLPEFCLPEEKNIGALDCLQDMADGLKEQGQCCVEKPVSVKKDTATSTAPSASGSGAVKGYPDRLIIPKDCLENGNCSLSDIVTTGVNFARFLMGLSGALFFAIFIYGGARYLTSFGNSSSVEKGKSAIKGATIGMIFVLCSWLIVQTLVKGLGADTSGKETADSAEGAAKSACEKKGEGWSCITMEGKSKQEVLANCTKKGYKCEPGLCSGGVTNICGQLLVK